MTRQVIPSMLLSVLIVCFFSILLYEPERAAPPRKAPGPAPGPEPSPSTPSASPKPDPVIGSATTPAAKPADSPASTANEAQKPPVPMPSEGEVPQQAPTSSPVPPPAVSDEKAPEASRADAAEAGPSTTSVAEPKPPESPSGAPSPFTTVKEGESLEDVSIRVYGTSDRIDMIWRANRDLLPRRDSPLPVGSVLRTPNQ